MLLNHTPRIAAAATRMHPSALPVPGAPGASGELAALPQAAERTPRPAASARTVYLALLTWAFTLFNSVRVVAYLPTLWAIQASGDSSQHSLWTWLTWVGANATMAAWLYEHNGQRINRAVMVNVGNTCMCLAAVLMIVAYRP
jgi:hypothetical protein